MDKNTQQLINELYAVGEAMKATNEKLVTASTSTMSTANQLMAMVNDVSKTLVDGLGDAKIAVSTLNGAVADTTHKAQDFVNAVSSFKMPSFQVEGASGSGSSGNRTDINPSSFVPKQAADIPANDIHFKPINEQSQQQTMINEAIANLISSAQNSLNQTTNTVGAILQQMHKPEVQQVLQSHGMNSETQVGSQASESRFQMSNLVAELNSLKHMAANSSAEDVDKLMQKANEINGLLHQVSNTPFMAAALQVDLPNALNISTSSLQKMSGEMNILGALAGREFGNMRDSALSYKNAQEEVNNSFENARKSIQGFGSDVKSVLGDVQNMAMGLASLTGISSAVFTARGIVQGSLQRYDKASLGQHNAAMAEMQLGVSPTDNPVLYNQLIETGHNRAWDRARGTEKYTYGAIGFESIPKTYAGLVSNVGGARGSNAETGAADLEKITNATVGFKNAYGIQDGELQSTVKTFYKDLGMSASETAYAINNLAQTAISANIPVGKYMQLVTQMASSYREIGLTGQNAIDVASHFAQKGFADTDVKRMGQSVGNAMDKFGDNQSLMAFSSVMSGQETDMFKAIRKGWDKWDPETGNPRKEYAPMIAKNIDYMAGIHNAAGGPAYGATAVKDMLVEYGFNKKDAAIMTNQYEKDPHALAAIIEKNKDKIGVSEEMSHATMLNDKLITAIRETAGRTFTGHKIADQLGPQEMYFQGAKTAEHFKPEVIKFGEGIGALAEWAGKHSVAFAGMLAFLSVLPGMSHMLTTLGAGAILKSAYGKVFGGGGGARIPSGNGSTGIMASIANLFKGGGVKAKAAGLAITGVVAGGAALYHYGKQAIGGSGSTTTGATTDTSSAALKPYLSAMGLSSNEINEVLGHTKRAANETSAGAESAKNELIKLGLSASQASDVLTRLRTTSAAGGHDIARNELMQLGLSSHQANEALSVKRPTAGSDASRGKKQEEDDTPWGGLAFGAAATIGGYGYLKRLSRQANEQAGPDIKLGESKETAPNVEARRTRIDRSSDAAEHLLDIARTGKIPEKPVEISLPKKQIEIPVEIGTGVDAISKMSKAASGAKTGFAQTAVFEALSGIAEYASLAATGKKVDGDGSRIVAEKTIGNAGTLIGGTIGGALGGLTTFGLGAPIGAMAGGAIGNWVQEKFFGEQTKNAIGSITEKFSGKTPEQMERERNGLPPLLGSQSSTSQSAAQDVNKSKIETDKLVSEQQKTTAATTMAAASQGKELEKVGNVSDSGSKAIISKLSETNSLLAAILAKGGVGGSSSSSSYGGHSSSSPTSDTAHSNSYSGSLLQGFGHREQEAIKSAAAKYNIDPNLLASQAHRESGGRQFDNKGKLILGGDGEIGMMQIMPSTARGLGIDPTSTEQNAMGGAKYLSQNLNKYNGDTRLALAAYNAGPGHVDSAIEKAGNRNWNDVSKHIYSSTQDYVSGIMSNVKETSSPAHTALGQQTHGGGPAKMVDIKTNSLYDVQSGLQDPRLMSDTKAKMEALAREYQAKFNEKMEVTGLTGARPNNPNSQHPGGNAFDIAGDSMKNATNRAWISDRAKSLGLSSYDEYANKSADYTGAHMHFGNSQESATGKPAGVNTASSNAGKNNEDKDAITRPLSKEEIDVMTPTQRAEYEKAQKYNAEMAKANLKSGENPFRVLFGSTGGGAYPSMNYGQIAKQVKGLPGDGPTYTPVTKIERENAKTWRKHLGLDPIITPEKVFGKQNVYSGATQRSSVNPILNSGKINVGDTIRLSGASGRDENVRVNPLKQGATSSVPLLSSYGQSAVNKYVKANESNKQGIYVTADKDKRQDVVGDYDKTTKNIETASDVSKDANTSSSTEKPEYKIMVSLGKDNNNNDEYKKAVQTIEAALKTIGAKVSVIEENVGSVRKSVSKGSAINYQNANSLNQQNRNF